MASTIDTNEAAVRYFDSWGCGKQQCTPGGGAVLRVLHFGNVILSCPQHVWTVTLYYWVCERGEDGLRFNI